MYKTKQPGIRARMLLEAFVWVVVLELLVVADVAVVEDDILVVENAIGSVEDEMLVVDNVADSTRKELIVDAVLAKLETIGLLDCVIIETSVAVAVAVTVVDENKEEEEEEEEKVSAIRYCARNSVSATLVKKQLI